MALTKKELEIEKDYLKETLKVLKDIISLNEGKIANVDNTIYEIKKYIWEYIAEIDPTEINSLENIASQHHSEAQLSYKRNLVFKRMLSSPYFGRIDFKSNIHNELKKIYIGISTISKNSLNYYVYDWRTPIASMFYDYQIGEAHYKSPRGIVEGNVILKRQYKIKDSVLEFAFDNPLNISDDILQETLSQNSSEKMKHIVNTIQQEQNVVIRNEDNKTLIVEGPAGSGKTSVALHHIAYLLYKYREKISSKNILIFSPNDVFSEYISGVLPDLGEENVYYTSFSDYMQKFISNYNHSESYMKFLERIFSIKDDEMKEIIKCKLSDKFINIIDSYVEIVMKNIKFNDITVNGQFVVGKEELENLFENVYSKYPPAKRIEKISENTQMKFRHMINGRVNAKALKKLIDSQLEFNIDYEDLLRDMYDNDEIKSSLMEICKDVDINKFIEVSKKQLDSNTINYEDAILLLYMKGKIAGFINDPNIKYVVIDEAQDYNRIQYVILKNIFNKAKFVILGDANQTVNTLFQYDSIKEITHIFSENEVEFIPLKTTYRNTYEITNFCNSILNLTGVNAINRHGDEPLLTFTKNKKESYKMISQKIKSAISKDYESIAIIAKNESICRGIITHLKKDGMNCGSYDDKAFKEQLVHVLPVYYAKGLEFDSVIVYDSIDGLRLPGEQKLFYVACTRALHDLQVIDESKLVLKGGLNEKVLCKTSPKSI